MLILQEEELCVCELTYALTASQPKISRHLALMREAGIVEARREGLWMHYRIHPDLPEWCTETLRLVYDQLKEENPYPDDRATLNQMHDRPEKICA